MLARVILAALLSVSLAGAKNYSITLSDTCLAGTTQLKPGEYTVKLDGSKVVLVDRSGRRMEVPAKVETVERKFERTAVTISKADGTNRLQSIDLAGSKSRVVFE